MAHEPESVFSLPVNVRRLSKKGQMFRFEASQQERRGIAERYDLIDVESFVCEAVVAPWKKDGVKVSGVVAAKIAQPCAVSGDALNQSVNEPVDMLFVPDGSRLSRPAVDADGEIVFDPMGDELPETFIGDSIDLAEVWLEFFSLGLNPYARLDGAEIDQSSLDVEQESPFSVLASMKPSLKKS